MNPIDKISQNSNINEKKENNNDNKERELAFKKLSEHKEAIKEVSEEALLNKIDLVYDTIKNNKLSKEDLKRLNILKEDLENDYYELTWFPVPYNQDWEMFTPLD